MSDEAATPMSFRESPFFSFAKRTGTGDVSEADTETNFPSLANLITATTSSVSGLTINSGSGSDSASGSDLLQQYRPLAEVAGSGSDAEESPLPQTYPAKDYLGPGQGCFAHGTGLLKDHVNYENYAANESRYDHITKLMAKTFKTPICHICLLANDRVWFRSTIMSEATGGFQERCYAWCNYVMIPTEPEILITENAPVDGRFARSPHVVGEPYLKFYAGAPLVGTGGRRYGTLCVVDFVPRTFTAELYHMLINFAELTCQELEKDWDLMAEWSAQAVSDARKRQRLRASLSTATHGVAMIDARLEDWNFVYANEMFYTSCGIGSAGGLGNDEELLLKSGLFNTFSFVSMSKKKVVKAIAKGGTVTTVCRCRKTGVTFRVSLRPACTDQLSPGKPVGVPSWVPSETDSDDSMGVDVEATRVSDMDPELCREVSRCFYFVVLQPVDLMKDSVTSLRVDSSSREPSFTDSQGATTGSTVSESSSSNIPVTVSSSEYSAQGGDKEEVWPQGGDKEEVWLADGSDMTYGDFHIPENIRPHLSIGTMIGSGSFGKVYRGKWRGVTVAVKVIETKAGAETSMAEAEAQLGTKFNNPYVVKTVVFSKQETQHQRIISNGVTAEVPASVMFVVQEMCDRGTLSDADWVHMMMTLLEIAMGMEYLHSQSIIHCDLTGRNVMLSRCFKDSRGFTAKVCDFGLSKVCHGDQLIPGCFGTLSHMAPEQFLNEAMMGSEVDVWAFGVIMWEMATGKRAMKAKKFPEIVMISRSQKGHSFVLPEGTPLGYQVIFSACLQKQPGDRPAFSKLVLMLRHTLREAMVYELEHK